MWIEVHGTLKSLTGLKLLNFTIFDQSTFEKFLEM